jgi:hypothetical protein
MSDTISDRLYTLLPAIYRIRDAKQGEPLRALLQIIEEQVKAIEEDIDGLYDDWFIETCADWVIPYIGDLVGNKPIHEVKQLRRTDVAKTIDYRRRKGTAAMLEEMARDVTGWGAHVVEFFKLLGWTQNLNHLRFSMSANPDPGSPNAVDRVGTVNIRSMDVLDRLDGPFDIISHTVDIRPTCCTEGWHSIRNSGFFLWRLRHYPLSVVTPRSVQGHPYCYTFSRLGNRAPLFHTPHREDDETGLATEIHVPGPIRPMAFDLDLQEFRKQPPGTAINSGYYGPERGLCIMKDGTPVPPENVVCMDLRHYDRPPGGKAAIDVERGLLSFAPGEEPVSPNHLAKFSVTYTYGFSADIGGGPYERRQYMVDQEQWEPEIEPDVIEVSKGTATNTIQKALNTWTANGKKPCVIRILDNGIYGGNIDIDLPKDGRLMIQAANGVCPNIRLVGISSLGVVNGSATVIMDGLLIEGAFEMSGGLNLTLQHCTMVPGRMLTPEGEPAFPDRDSLVVKTGSDDLCVTINRCIIGPIRMPASGKCLAISDSIIQAPLVKGKNRFAIAADDVGDKPGPPTVIDRSTVFGPVFVKELVHASESIFTSRVKTERQQVGCVRFSYVPEGSLVPRRYHCQPDLAIDREAENLQRELTLPEKDFVMARMQPHFTSRRYGDPGYAQIIRACAEEIRTGAEDGSEMGVFAHLKQPQREDNLRIRLMEYLPFGLEAGFIFVT